MRMKDEGGQNSVSANDEDGKVNGEVTSEMGSDDVVESHAALNSNGKSRTKPGRKRRGSSSPEEDIIDGFAISSYASLNALESCGPTKPDNINRRHSHHKMAKRNLENGVNGKKRKSEKRRARLHHGHKQRDSDSEEDNKDRPKREAPQNSATTNQYDSDSGSSGRGYLCDAESEDERASDNEDAQTVSTPNSSSFSARNAVSASKASLSDGESESGKRTSKPSDWPCSAAVTSQRPESRNSVTTTAALSLSLGTSTTASHPVTPTFGPSHHGAGLFPHFPSFHSPAAHLTYPHGPPDGPPFGPYPSTEFLRQELNTRFLQAHGDRAPGLHAPHFLHYENHQHLHNHQHQHSHQHSHQHFHGALSGGPLFSPTTQPLLRKSPDSCGIFRPKVPLPGPPVHMKDSLGIPHVHGGCLPPPSASLVQSPHMPRKPGKWCAAHVQIAWQMYYHQQEFQKESHKDPHLKPEQISLGPRACLSLHGSSNREAVLPHPSLVRGQGDVSPLAGPPPPHPGPTPFLPASAIPPSSSNLGLTSPFLGGLSARPTAMMSLGSSSLGGVGPGFGSPFRSTSGANFGSGLSSSYMQGFGHEWGHGTSPTGPFPTWLSRGTERERLIDREREREKARERERERDRSDAGSPPLGARSRASSERDRPASDDDGEGSKHKDGEKSGSEERRTPPASRPLRSSDFNIASLTGESKSDSSLENRNSVGRSSVSGRRDDGKPTDSRPPDEPEVVVLPNERHVSAVAPNHGPAPGFLDRRGLFDDRARDSYEPLARFPGHPPGAHVGGFLQCSLPPSIFPPGNPHATHYLSGAPGSAVSHAPGMPGYLSGRSMLGMPLGGLPGARSRSPIDVPPPVDILKATDNRP